MPNLTLLTNATANGNGTAIIYTGRTGSADISVYGTFGGASVQLQYNFADDFGQASADWINIGDAITAPKVQRIDLSYNTMLRAVISSASGTTSISSKLNFQ
jgi:hypothetical protein